MTVTTETVTTHDTVTGPDDRVDPSAPPVGAGTLVEEDLLVEDVSIDGMCGVY
jgi:mycofactocin precursor